MAIAYTWTEQILSTFERNYISTWDECNYQSSNIISMVNLGLHCQYEKYNLANSKWFIINWLSIISDI